MFPFVYLTSVCRSLQCLISALTQAEVVSCLGSLVQSCCEEGGALQTNVTGVCAEHSQCSGHTGFAPAHAWRVCFPRLHCSGSRLLYMEWALSCLQFQFSGTLQKRRLGWACVLCLPWPSSSGSHELDECTLPRYRAPYPLRSPSLNFHTRLLGAPCVCSGELISSYDPSQRVSTIQNLGKSLVRNWEPVCSLVGDAISEAEFAPFPSPLPPASGGG